MSHTVPGIPELIDTHCHLDDGRLAAPLEMILERARAAGVTRFVVPGVGPDGWGEIARIAREHPGVFSAPGLHPMRAAQHGPASLQALALCLDGAVAVGEIGLDYTLDGIPRDVQQTAFRAQLRLAVEAGVPVLIHCRRAFEDTLRILREERVGQVGGIMHAFSGSPEIARAAIDLGFCISIAGTVTYGNAVRPVELVRALSLDCLVLETDAPDMTPEPHRGIPNEPAFLQETARRVADIKGVPPAELARSTTAAAERLLKLKRSTVS